MNEADSETIGMHAAIALSLTPLAAFAGVMIGDIHQALNNGPKPAPFAVVLGADPTGMPYRLTAAENGRFYTGNPDFQLVDGTTQQVLNSTSVRIQEVEGHIMYLGSGLEPGSTLQPEDADNVSSLGVKMTVRPDETWDRSTVKRSDIPVFTQTTALPDAAAPTNLGLDLS